MYLKECNVPGCGESYRLVRGLCNRHYQCYRYLGSDYNTVVQFIEPIVPLYFCKKHNCFLNKENSRNKKTALGTPYFACKQCDREIHQRFRRIKRAKRKAMIRTKNSAMSYLEDALELIGSVQNWLIHSKSDSTLDSELDKAIAKINTVIEELEK